MIVFKRPYLNAAIYLAIVLSSTYPNALLNSQIMTNFQRSFTLIQSVKM